VGIVKILVKKEIWWKRFNLFFHKLKLSWIGIQASSRSILQAGNELASEEGIFSFLILLLKVSVFYLLFILSGDVFLFLYQQAKVLNSCCKTRLLFPPNVGWKEGKIRDWPLSSWEKKNQRASFWTKKPYNEEIRILGELAGDIGIPP